MRRWGGVGIVLGLAAAVAAVSPPRRQVVVLQPLGSVDAALLEAVRTDVAGFFDVDAKTAPVTPLPSSAWYEPRTRYRADRLLAALGGVAPEADRLVGITTSDISVTKGEHPDWGIFGLGSLGGRTCVVSTFRLRRGPAAHGLLLERLRKVVRHELGHTWGLEHCPTPHCLMQDCEGTIHTVDGEPGLLCARCREALRRLGLAGGPAALAGER